MSVTLFNCVDVSKLKYSEPKILNNQSKIVYVNYDGEKLLVQTPMLNIPYGLNTANNSMNVSLSDDILKKMNEIEEKVKNDVFENRILWLREDYDGMKEVVDRLFYPIVKHHKDKETGKVTGRFTPTMKVKLPVADDFALDTEGHEIKLTDHADCLKGGRCKLIIQLTGIWLAGGKFGCTWKVVKGKFLLRERVQYDFIEN